MKYLKLFKEDLKNNKEDIEDFLLYLTDIFECDNNVNFIFQSSGKRRIKDPKIKYSDDSDYKEFYRYEFIISPNMIEILIHEIQKSCNKLKLLNINFGISDIMIKSNNLGSHYDDAWSDVVGILGYTTNIQYRDFTYPKDLRTKTIGISNCIDFIKTLKLLMNKEELTGLKFSIYIWEK